MDMIPERIRDHEREEDGSVQVLYPRFEWGPLKKWLMPRLKNPFIRVNLDSVGSCVWEAIDGKKTVYEIGKEVCASLGEKEDENWHWRMGTFMQMLKNRDLIQLREQKKSKDGVFYEE